MPAASEAAPRAPRPVLTSPPVAPGPHLTVCPEPICLANLSVSPLLPTYLAAPACRLSLFFLPVSHLPSATRHGFVPSTEGEREGERGGGRQGEGWSESFKGVRAKGF